MVGHDTFPEMTTPQVAEYFALIDSKVKGVFFCQQLRSARTHSYDLGEIARHQGVPVFPELETGMPQRLVVLGSLFPDRTPHFLMIATQ